MPLASESSVKGSTRIMRKRLQIALMLTASAAIATSYSLHPQCAWAEESNSASRLVTTTDEHGRKIYVNESAPAETHAIPSAQPKRPTLMYWSAKENRWKPVPSNNTPSMQAA